MNESVFYILAVVSPASLDCDAMNYDKNVIIIHLFGLIFTYVGITKTILAVEVNTETHHVVQRLDGVTVADNKNRDSKQQLNDWHNQPGSEAAF